ncbi:1-phosphofructokinase family hexose kinase [Curtobacterium sp. RRHDQ10]|uniref:1-phosphofructokinase family hexose kinase n=1 Tax=Curtobacterium phyllosphaerae TaxID=3413379 RepID=UPI003BEF6570
MAPVVVITPNPAVDVTYRVAEQRIGETQRVLEVIRRPGGKGINVVRVLEALGAPAISVAPLGGSAGRWVGEELDALGITHRAVPIGGPTRTTVTVVDDRAHPTMFGEPGPVLTAAEWTRFDGELADVLPGADGLVVAGSLPAGADPALVGRWVDLARSHGVPTVVDVSGAALLAAADAGADVVKPNRDELLEATGAPTEAAGAADLLRRGAGTVVVSRGAEGIVAYRDGDPIVRVAAVPGVHGNPTGAGDAATAGLVSALRAAPRPEGAPLDRVSLDVALRQAAAAGAAAVLRPVAGEIDLAAFHRFRDDLSHATPSTPFGDAP